MSTTGFDTLKVSRDLEAAGFNEAQAGAIVRSMAGAFQDGMIATKSDIDKLRASTRADVDKLRTSTTAEFAAVRTDIDKLRASTRADVDKLQTFTTAEFAAVRTEIDRLRVSTKSDFDKLQATTTADIANLKAEVFRALWIQGAGIVGIHLAIGGLLFAAIRFLA